MEFTLLTPSWYRQLTRPTLALREYLTLKMLNRINHWKLFYQKAWCLSYSSDWFKFRRVTKKDFDTEPTRNVEVRSFFKWFKPKIPYVGNKFIHCFWWYLDHKRDFPKGEGDFVFTIAAPLIDPLKLRFMARITSIWPKECNTLHSHSVKSQFSPLHSLFRNSTEAWSKAVYMQNILSFT